MPSSKSEPRTTFTRLHDSQSAHALQAQSYMSPNAQQRANISLLTLVTFGIIHVVLVACMTDSHAYSYLHMARQNEVCLLAADSAESAGWFITERSQSGPVEP